MGTPVSYIPNEHNKVSALVDHVLFKKDLKDSWYQWFLEMCLWHLRELRLDTWQDVKTVSLPVTNRKTVLLPNDFVDWTKVGIKVGQYIVTLGVNDKLTVNERTSSDTSVAGLLSQNLPNGLDFSNYGGYQFMNFMGSSFWGIGRGFITKGHFKYVDHGSFKELLLDYDYSYDHVYVEYITDGFDPCGETIVSPYICDFLVKGMEFSYEEEKELSRTEASIRRRGIAFEVAGKKVRGRRNDLDPQTILNISRSGVRFTPKI